MSCYTYTSTVSIHSDHRHVNVPGAGGARTLTIKLLCRVNTLEKPAFLEASSPRAPQPSPERHAQDHLRKAQKELGSCL